MHIQILGTGCPKCTKLYENARAAAERSGTDVTI
ncbi:MAG: thioredoxin family protein, partial [Planctomycetota bacterium]